MDAKHTSQIDIKVNDSLAQAAVDSLLDKLARARDLAAGIQVGGGAAPQGPTPGSTAPASTAPGEPAPSQPAPPPPPTPGSSGGGGVTPPAAPGGGSGGGGDGGGGGGRGHAGPTAGELFIAMTMRAGLDSLRAALTPAASAPLNALASVTQIGGAALGKLGGMAKGLPFLGSVLQGGAELAGLAFSTMGKGVELRHQEVLGLAALERAQKLSEAAGGVGLGIKSGIYDMGAQYGMMPSETAAMFSAFAQQVGFKGSGRFTPNLAGAAAAGIGPGAIGAVLSTGAPGGGATPAQAYQGIHMVAGAAYGMGLRGSGIEQALQTIAGYTKSMAEQGLNISPTDLGALAMGLGQLPGFEGQRAFSTTTWLGGLGQAAAQGFIGNMGLGGMAETAIQAYAFKRAGSPMEAVSIMQQLAGDSRALVGAIMESLGGGEAAQFALAGAGLTPEQALAIQNWEIPEAGALNRAVLPSARGGGLSAKLAGQAVERLRMEQATGTSGQLLDTVQEIRIVLMKFGEKADIFLELFNSLLSKVNGVL